MTALENQVLADIEPNEAEQAAMADDAQALTQAADQRLHALKVPGQATVQGSVAKGTWLRGSGDIDLFLLLDPAVPEARLESIAEEVGKGVLTGVHKRYAQHPYLMGEFRGRAVDLVPAYRVAAAGAKMSAVDRTPFHTAWVRANLDAQKRGEARLLKRWLKGVSVYGAQTAIGGFSGYLAEVLIAQFVSLRGVVDWLAADARPRRIALGPDQVQDEVSPLIVVDPVDPARNCAAAVQEPTLARAVEAARAYLAHPERRFFFPAPQRAEDAKTLASALRHQNAAWMGLLLRPRTDRLDIVFPQFQKGARAIAAAIAQAGFPVTRLECLAAPDEREVLLQWMADARELPASRTHRGPLAGVNANAERFRAKWEGHADAIGPVQAAATGHLEVEVRVPQRTAAAWMQAHLQEVQVGRHVADAMADGKSLSDPAHVPAAWAPAVAEFILDRRPWTR